jgi:multicomponent K+:H+ antiporter subunit E
LRRLLPHPLLAAVLLVVWLLLTQSLTPGQFLLGALVALIGTHGMAALRPQPVTVRRPKALLRLCAIVVADIVRSNFAVASIVLLGRRERVSGFIHLPLELTNPHALAILAVIITATPGSLWVEFDGRRSVVLVHVLDLVDEEQWVSLIKKRYESLLLEIFCQ